ncbi:unnamed protein product [Anisakis simplex]|uniref:DYF-2 (inferred by orthology to a C. elegans protein) n=1 Tax=Anisakis simplex TaxID=6269 RepID=A0A0M3J756_ANISI|nr:unnamed protein product [Anisakis simplex]
MSAGSSSTLSCSVQGVFSEAFQLAEAEQKMNVYAEAIDDEGTVEQFSQLAEFYSSIKNYSSAGKYHYRAKHYRKALDLLLLNGEDSEAIKTAIECVAEARDADLCKQLTDFLMGETDGIPKKNLANSFKFQDAKYLFRFYVAMQMNQEAAKTAIIIAREEQNRGSYRMAHHLLFEMHQELVHKQIKVPYEMQNNLMLLHSYLIVKVINLIHSHNHRSFLIRSLHKQIQILLKQF